VGKRGDGYHLLDTVLVPVTLYDELIIRRVGRRSKNEPLLKVTCDHPQVPQGEANLAHRAASMLLAERRFPHSIQIHIRKRIPVGSGLGGGSSDAAATLLGLNRWLNLGRRRKDLLALAASLGADVPFFLYGCPARATGIGERLRPFRLPGRVWVVILYPPLAISTKWVYDRVKLTKSIEKTSINFSLESPVAIDRFLVNDLEKVTIRHYPAIGLLKERLLQEGAAAALMSGSGSSVFGIFLTRQKARTAFSRLRRQKGFQAFLAHSLS
jgi:4-diphosphocytidyl-2-C-methyl-D-erythritol kinase